MRICDNPPPLTEGTDALLKLLDERDIPRYGQSGASVRRFNSLQARGYATKAVVEGKTVWRITEEGRKVRYARIR